MLAKTRAIYDFFCFVVTVFGIIALMYMFRKHHRKLRQKWAVLQRFLMGYTIKTKGTIDEEVQMVVINHQSLLDIVVLEEIHPKDLCWIAKKEIENIPLFGHIVKVPYMISVEREDKRSMIKLLKDVKDRVEKGRVIAIFPEGTRSNGDKLLKFKQGAKFLAQKLNLKIMPIVITNSNYILDSKKFIGHTGEITVNYLPSIDPNKDENWYEKMYEDMKKVLNDELANNPSHR